MLFHPSRRTGQDSCLSWALTEMSLRLLKAKQTRRNLTPPDPRGKWCCGLACSLLTLGTCGQIMLTTFLHCHTTIYFWLYLLSVVTRGHVAWWTSTGNKAEECLGFRARLRAHPHLRFEEGGSTALTNPSVPCFDHCCFFSPVFGVHAALLLVHRQ